MTQPLLNSRFAIVDIKSVSNYSKVFLALDVYQTPPRNCEIEVYRPNLQAHQLDQRISQEFQTKLAYLKQLSLINLNLPEIYTYFDKSQAYYIVREQVEGLTLKEKVQTTGKFSPERVREILVQLLLLLDKIHQQDIVHQNIKPQNIILHPSDNRPILTNIDCIKQITANLIYAEQKENLEKSIIDKNQSHIVNPAVDLAGLGLTAVYLLTGKNHFSLSAKANSGSYRIPPEIKQLDANLAKVITQAINSNLNAGYSSAQAMLVALSSPKSKAFFRKNQNIHLDNNHSIASTSNPDTNNRHHNSNRLMVLSLVTGILCLINLSLTAWYTWKLSQNTTVLQLPESPRSLPNTILDPPTESESTQQTPSTTDNNSLEEKTLSTQNNNSQDTIFSSQPKWTEIPSTSDNNSQVVSEIPIFTTGIPKQQLKTVLGEPNSIKTGYWDNSSAWIYKNQADGSIDLGYLFDLDTGELRQTEIAIAPAVDLETMTEVLDGLLEGNLTESITQELEKIYQGKADEYTFELKDVEGKIKRDQDDKIYIGIWEADFH